MIVDVTLPELRLEDSVAEWIETRCAVTGELFELEQAMLSGTFEDPFLAATPWAAFRRQVLALWNSNDHVILRGVPAVGDGGSALLAALALGSKFKSFRGDKIVKHFRLSPWTRDLSHTIEEGHFHTDINTAPNPPFVTTIQCKLPDPGGPNFGQVRIARLSDILRAIEQFGEPGTLRFLQDTDVTSVNESSPEGWTGRIVANNQIRFHPETLRAAQRRYGNLPPNLEVHLQVIKAAALSVSTPIHLGPGDAMFVSNTRALHYRGACSVSFRTFPRDFVTREVYVFHLLNEPA